jgi:hypothetical protein
LKAQSVNLLPNADFELDENADGLPDDWDFGGQDAKTRKWYRDAETLSLVYSLSGSVVRSGRRSLRSATGRAVDKWMDAGTGVYIRTDVFPAMAGGKVHFRGYAYLESGSGVVPIRFRQFAEKGFIGMFMFKPDQEIPGRWLKMEETVAIDPRAASLRLHLDMARPHDPDTVFYSDDFNLQPLYPRAAQLRTDKREYFMSDRKAFTTVAFNLGVPVLMPARAELARQEGAPEPVTVLLRTVLSEDFLKDKRLKLSVHKDEQAVLTREVPATPEVSTALDIGKLQPGAYTLSACVVDAEGRTVFTVSKTVHRSKGPFDF